MKPSSLLRLYPRAWRERYGDEFLAMFDRGALNRHESLDIACAAVVEWTRRPVAGPSIVACACGVAASLVGRLLRAVAVPPSEVITAVVAFLAVFAIGYILWRSNEWLFERTPHTGRRLLQIGLALAITAGIFGAWTESTYMRSAIWWLRPNAAFFWAGILWSARLQSILREQHQELN